MRHWRITLPRLVAHCSPPGGIVYCSSLPLGDATNCNTSDSVCGKASKIRNGARGRQDSEGLPFVCYSSRECWPACKAVGASSVVQNSRSAEHLLLGARSVPIVIDGGVVLCQQTLPTKRASKPIDIFSSSCAACAPQVRQRLAHKLLMRRRPPQTQPQAGLASGGCGGLLLATVGAELVHQPAIVLAAHVNGSHSLLNQHARLAPDGHGRRRQNNGGRLVSRYINIHILYKLRQLARRAHSRFMAPERLALRGRGARVRSLARVVNFVVVVVVVAAAAADVVVGGGTNDEQKRPGKGTCYEEGRSFCHHSALPPPDDCPPRPAARLD
jgi:hypothetical protein